MSDATAYGVARPRAESTCRTTAVARLVSDLCSPAALALPCLLLAVWTSQSHGAIWYAVLYSAVAIPLPMLYVVWLVKTGRVTDFHLPRRHERARPFMAALFCALTAVVLLAALGAPAGLLAPIVAVFLQTLALFLITLLWQISIHTATTAGLATFALLALGVGGALLLPIVPLVAWARIHLGRHTVSQTVAGSLLGVATFLVLFSLRGTAW